MSTGEVNSAVEVCTSPVALSSGASEEGGNESCGVSPPGETRASSAHSNGAHSNGSSAEHAWSAAGSSKGHSSWAGAVKGSFGGSITNSFQNLSLTIAEVPYFSCL